MDAHTHHQTPPSETDREEARTLARAGGFHLDGAVFDLEMESSQVNLNA